MAAFTATTLDGILKRLYKGDAVANLAYNEKARPLFTDLEKKTDFQGKNYPVPVIYANGGAVGGDFATVQANARSSKIAEFSIDVGKQYGVATIESDAVERGRSNPGAFIETLKHFNDTVIASLADRIEQLLWSDTYASIGTVGSGGISSNTFTLATVEDASKFYPGLQIVMAASTSAAPRTGTATVVSVNLDTGVIVLDSTPTSAAAGDLIFYEADYTGAGVENGLAGIPAWLPATAPGSTPFFGVDRSVDPVRLGGLRSSGSSSDVLAAIKSAARKMSRHFGQSFDHAYLSHDNFQVLLNQLNTEVRRTDGKQKTVVGTAEVEIYAGSSIVKCRPTTHLNNDHIYGLTMSDWSLVSMLEPIRLITLDGLRIRASATADSWESRWVSRCQPVCRAPGRSVNITLS